MSGSHPGRLGWGMLVVAFTLAIPVAQAAATQKAAIGEAVAVPFTPCRRGDALLALGRVAAAETAYEGELTEGATVQCAREGLAEIGGKRPCAAAKALWLNGDKEGAGVDYVESLEQKPTRDCAAVGVAESTKSGFLDKLSGWAGDVLDALEKLLLVIAVSLLVLSLFGLALIWFLFHLPATKKWATRRYARPTVSVTTVDDSGLKEKLGAGMAVRLRQHLELDPGDGALKLVSGEASTAEVWIGKVSEVGDRGKVVALIIDLAYRIVPRQHVSVRGTLQAPTRANGHGISLELHQETDAGESATLWATRFGLTANEGAEAVQGLAVPAAAWASHVIARETNAEGRLGAKDPTSWALFKAGVELQRTSRPGRAAFLYEEALAIDPDNYGALTNLGLIEARSGSYAKALPRLRRALVRLERGQA
jgi:tetratricopeptide (TPR) repeat protein